MIGALFEVILILAFIYTLYRFTFWLINKMQQKETLDRIDHKIDEVKGAKKAINKYRDLRRERESLRTERRMYELELENMELKNQTKKETLNEQAD